jgi:hypothetical protein
MGRSIVNKLISKLKEQILISNLRKFLKLKKSQEK